MEEPSNLTRPPRSTTARWGHFRRSAPLRRGGGRPGRHSGGLRRRLRLGVCQIGEGSSTSTSSARRRRAPRARRRPARWPSPSACARTGFPTSPTPRTAISSSAALTRTTRTSSRAIQACQHLLPGGSATNGGGSGSNSSAELAFAHCMQTHGVPNFPDPSSNGALADPPGCRCQLAAVPVCLQRVQFAPAQQRRRSRRLSSSDVLSPDDGRASTVDARVHPRAGRAPASAERPRSAW